MATDDKCVLMQYRLLALQIVMILSGMPDSSAQQVYITYWFTDKKLKRHSKCSCAAMYYHTIVFLCSMITDKTQH